MKKSGIYRLTFDTETLKFDLEYKSEIVTPVYIPMKNCSVYTIDKEWTVMEVNPDNPDEYFLKDYEIKRDSLVSFFSNDHTSNYKITLDEGVKDKFVSGEGIASFMNIGGVYDIFVNKYTYEVRFSIKNLESADFGCIYYDGEDFIELEPVDEATPYLFRQRIEVTTKNTTSVPKFYSGKYTAYKLKVKPSELLSSTEKYSYFKNVGTYDLTVDLMNFEITVELASAE